MKEKLKMGQDYKHVVINFRFTVMYFIGKIIKNKLTGYKLLSLPLLIW